MGTKDQDRAGIFKGRSGARAAPSASRSALSGLAGITYSWDIAADTLTWSPNAAEILGLSPQDLPRTGRDFSHLIEPGSGVSRHDAILGAREASGAYDTRYALRFGADQVVMVQDAGHWQPDAEGRPAFVRGQMRTDQKSAAREPLPALVRARSELLCSIQNDINEALRFSHTCTLIVGAFEGSELPGQTEVARALRPMLRHNDHVTALGSGRFVLTLTCCPASEAANAMKRASALLNSLPGGSSLQLGAACAPDHTFQAVKLLRFAEQALLLARESGQSAMLHDLRHKAGAGTQAEPLDLVGALNDRRLILAGQPMVDAQSFMPALTQTCPALPGLRGGVVPLGPVPNLSKAGLALLVDGRMLELAAERLGRHPDERLVLPISAITLHDTEWLPMLAAHLGAHPGAASRLFIEIPETALITSRTIRGRLDAMKALGLGVALAGSGIGHVPPAHLRNLPIDLLKIDGVFIQPLKRSVDDRLFVRTLIDTAQRLGIATAAEWVDDEPTARLLSSWGVDYLQGILFGEPFALSQPGSLLQSIMRMRA